MKARTAVLSTIFVALFAFSASAQQYYRPNYTQRQLPELYTAPVFLENRTDGHLKVTLEVGGTLVFVEVLMGHEVPDLMLPVGLEAKVKKAEALVLDGNKRKWKKAKHYAYWRHDENGVTRQGWMFYTGDNLRPF